MTAIGRPLLVWLPLTAMKFDSVFGSGRPAAASASCAPCTGVSEANTVFAPGVTARYGGIALGSAGSP